MFILCIWIIAFIYGNCVFILKNGWMTSYSITHTIYLIIYHFVFNFGIEMATSKNYNPFYFILFMNSMCLAHFLISSVMPIKDYPIENKVVFIL